jgi:triacylglycerol lipase
MKDHNIRVTGHSLGGAIALILTNYIYKEGYKVERLVTFGQPKVTDDKTNHRYKVANPDYKKITRVVRENDPVPMVPARSKYGHVGPELILKEGQDYVFLDAHEADRLSIGDLWRNAGDVEIKDHSMELYLSNIQGKIQGGAQQVAYAVN